jgi:hypothetical protein
MIAPTVSVVDGTLVIDWPDPSPRSFEITAEAFEGLVDRANGRADDQDYIERLATFIISHIGKPYTAEECGQILEIR